MDAAKWLLIAIIIVAIVLAGFVVYQGKNKIVISSLIPDVSVAITNKTYLNNKLDESGFWKKNNVTFYQGAFRTPVTVKRLSIRLVDSHQQWGRLVDAPSSTSPTVYMSFGTQYDPASQTMHILLHVRRNNTSLSDINKMYSAELLVAIYDITRLSMGNVSEQDRRTGQNAFLGEYLTAKVADSDLIITTR